MSSSTVRLLDLVGARSPRSGVPNGGNRILMEYGCRRVAIQCSFDLASDLAVFCPDADHLLLQSVAEAMKVGR